MIRNRIPYFSLVHRDFDGRWRVEFGSYDRVDCVDEVLDKTDNGTKASDLKIIRTDDGQADVESAVRTLNKETK